jgi:hypothetical protein
MTTHEDIAKSQAHVDDLYAQQVDLHKQLAKAQLDQRQVLREP